MQDPLALAILVGAAQIAAGIALCNGIGAGIGQGTVVAAAIEAMARQPESAGSVRSTMFIGLAMAETAAIYGVVFAIILLFANPLLGSYAHYFLPA